MTDALSRHAAVVHGGGPRLSRPPQVPLRGWRAWLDRAGPLLVMWPPLIVSAAYVVVFTLWTIGISFTRSTLLPDYTWAGTRNYEQVLTARAWSLATTNLLIYGAGFLLVTTGLGLLLAILIDQRVRGENVFRAIYLYPMAVSFVVTGTVWSWLLNPSLGIQKLVRDFGWTNFRFDWIIDRDLAICTVIIAGVWQATGFAMVLFLAGIRSVNADLLRAAQIDGAGPWRTYRRVVLPSMTPIVLSVLVILLQFAIKTFDLVLALTSGGPGLASTLPTLVIYDFLFQRGLMARGSAAAILLLLSVVVVVGPYLAYVQWRRYRELSNA
jgi:glucose/mannose transport system permease protein